MPLFYAERAGGLAFTSERTASQTSDVVAGPR